MLTLNITKPLHGSSGDMTLDVDLQIEQGSFVALSGASGSGKTTLLRILAGLEEAVGEICMGDKVWLDGKFAITPQSRSVGFVFQSYALFPNMSIEEHLLFVNRDRGLAEQLIEMTGLAELRNRKPHTLSGGQQQRVALCRAMMGRPKLLLMDEPLSALDHQMRTRLQREILALHKLFGTTIIMVSHEPSEIYRMADRVVVLESGKVTSDGEPKDVLLRTTGSQKFSFEGEILELVQADVIIIAIVAIGQQIVEIVLGIEEAKGFRVGERVAVSTKAFAPMLSKIDTSSLPQGRKCE
ncbi:MAG: ATP-binding cassette domain-containing protein [Sulfurovum sp.]|nr:ATP-binding cassette domain-containing protein [Sulfurovum sp.]